MKRADKDLAFMLQYENVAWYEDGSVRILDRRIYPERIEYVVCRDYMQVAQAIADMVTQSAGPYTAAGMGMALAAFACRDKSLAEQATYMQTAAHALSHARPTTTARMQGIAEGCLAAAERARTAGQDVAQAIFEHTVETMNHRYQRMTRVGECLADLFPQNGVIMTQCFGETIVGTMLREAKRRGNAISIICPETRPYFQGARLTASVAQDMGFDVTVITDNMPAYTMQAKHVELFTSAADAICMDGSVVNKVGTFQIAIAANYHGIPYFVTGAPDRAHASADTIHIEERDPQEVLEARGRQTAMAGVKGFYPAFDITPPHLVSGVVTDKGIYSPYDLPRYFAGGEAGLFENAPTV